MSGIGLGLGLGNLADAPGFGPLVPAVLSVTKLPDGTLQITAADGTLTLTILSPSPFAGSYEITTEALAAGPVNLVPPTIAGTGAVGSTLTATPGLWAFDAAGPAPVLGVQWLRDGLAIPGATGLTVAAPAEGGVLRFEETLTQSGTGAATASASLTIVRPQTQTVTVPAGRVGADLPGFPVRFDLSSLTPALWSQLRADGGNLRATDAADTVSYPLDIVWIDAASRTGTAFIRRDLAAASATSFVLRARDAGTTAAAVTAPDGRNAVWGGYLAVLAFPDRIDRTGQRSVTELGSFTDSYVVEKVSPDIQMHQGVAWDGTHWFVVDTNQIKKFDASWTLVQTASNPIGAAGIPGTNHLGDPCIHNGELLIPLETWPSGPFTNQHIAVYSTADLSFVRSHNISATGREASSFAINPANGLLYCTDFTNGANIPFFTPDGVYQGTLPLSQTVTNIQGITFHAGKMFLSSDTADQLYEVSASGTVTPVPVYTSLLGGSFEGITSDGTSLYVLIDSVPSSVYRLRPARFSNQLQFAAQALKVGGIPSTTAWTASVSVVPHALSNNGAVVSLVQDGSETNRATAVVRTSSDPDSYNAWSNSNSWMTVTAPQVPVVTQRARLAYGYNGTTRKLLLNGAPYATQTGMTARPGGTTMSWFVGAEDSTPTEYVKGTLAFAFLYDGFASDPRLAAEFATLHDTQNFYTLS